MGGFRSRKRVYMLLANAGIIVTTHNHVIVESHNVSVLLEERLKQISPRWMI